MTVVNVGTKKCVIKRKLKYENYKNCLEVIQLENKINHLENHKKITWSNKSILKTQQRLKSERHNVFTEEISKIVLSSNDNKKMKSIDSIETYAYETSKDLVNETEGTKFSNIIKPYKKLLTL